MYSDNIRPILDSLTELEKENWRKEIVATFNNSELIALSLDDIVLALLASNNEVAPLLAGDVLAYGAGKMAEKYLPSLSEKISFFAIWDLYSELNSLYNIKISRPVPVANNKDIAVVIFIDNAAVRNEVIAMLMQYGIKHIYYFRDVIDIISGVATYQKIKKYITHKTEDTFFKFVNNYRIVNNIECPVLFTAYKRSSVIQIEYTDFNLMEAEIKNGILKRLIIDDCVSLDNSIQKFICEIQQGLDFAESLEIFLEKVLTGGIKTRKRPIRMADDRPYDSFSIFEVLDLIFDVCFPKKIKLNVARYIKEISLHNAAAISAYIHVLLQENIFDEALTEARNAAEEMPNSLIINEAFVAAALLCKKNDIKIEEPLPQYDLNERFCWSGINFAWCGDIDKENRMPIFGPCFRPLQCAARPSGEFWESDEWKEFRKSLVDGSFRYCQKNQCPNIVAGWLPKKADIKDSLIHEIFKGNYDVIPKLEELHFSYDGHCNLRCPSCRLEFRTNTEAEVALFNDVNKKQLLSLLSDKRHLCLSGCGEAIISPTSKKLLMALSPAENPELEVELRTNMTMLNKKNWDSLGEGRKCIKHIAASIDSCKKDTFEKLRWPAKWEMVCDNLRFVQMLRNKNEIDMFEFHVVVQRDNVSELLDIVKMAISYDADCITFSRLINWRGMSTEEYRQINPFWPDNDKHDELMRMWKSIIAFRDSIECGKNILLKKKFYINLHFVPDPNSSYDEIRLGRIKIR